MAFFFLYVPGKKLYEQIQTTLASTTKVQQAISDKDLNLGKQQLADLKVKIALIKKQYQYFAFTSKLPYINNYYNDGNLLLKIIDDSMETGDILIKAVEPYQDFLGLKGSSTSGEKTTQDRIKFLTESVEGLAPHLDTIEVKIGDIETSLNKIDPNRYPEEYNGKQIRSKIYKAKETLASVHKLIKDGKPIISKTSWLLGKDKPRTYLIVFQNDAELRPTGGFWTAFGLIKIDNGKVTPLGSADIYSLDAKLNSKIPAPRPIKAYHINVPYYNLRDMNISPDFPTSADIFLTYFQKLSGNKEKIDAVVALDTRVLVDLVRIIGRVGVSEFGNFSADPDKRCDGCPQIIYQLEWIAGRPRNYIETNRKGFLGPLMQAILGNAMGAGKEKIGPLVQVLINNLFDKHLMVYFTDKDMQSAAELANIAGKINQDENIDYIHLNDANMSSAKTNLFLKQKIKHEIIVKNGKIEHKITTTYINPSKASNCNLEKGDLCLNAPKYRNWFRFYTPKGSELIKMTGSEVEPVVYEELNRQVFEGFYGDKFPLYAKSQLKTTIDFYTSIKPSKDYTLLLQKQAGTKAMEYDLYVNGKKYETFSWTGDKTIKLPL